MNVVRLPILYTLLVDEDDGLRIRPDAWVHIDRAIELAEAAGIHTILDLHGAPGGQNPWHHCGREDQNQLWGNEENKRRTVWLWEQIARRYKGRGAVAAYDLLNEPYSAPKEDLKALMLEIYAAVRAVDPDHVIIFPSLPEGFEFYGRPEDLGLTKVAFTAHFYPGFFGWGDAVVKTHADWLTHGAREWRDRVEAAGVPLLVGEMNVVLKQAGGAEMMRHAYDTYTSFGWSTTMWSYKVFSREGSTRGGSWGMVTNPPGRGAPLVKAETWTSPGWDLAFAASPGGTGATFTVPGTGPVSMCLVIKVGVRDGKRIDMVLDEVHLVDDSTGHDMVVNGGFGTGRSWKEWRHRGDLSLEYGYSGSAPAGGAGPCLRLTADGFAQGGVWQTLALQGGQAYTLSGVSRDIGSSREAAWLEVYVHTDAPVQDQNYVGDPAPGADIDLRTSSYQDIEDYFRSLSQMEYVVYEDLRHWLTTAESPGLLSN
jgi:glucan 1,3-beta-glucosidase